MPDLEAVLKKTAKLKLRIAPQNSNLNMHCCWMDLNNIVSLFPNYRENLQTQTNPKQGVVVINPNENICAGLELEKDRNNAYHLHPKPSQILVRPSLLAPLNVKLGETVYVVVGMVKSTDDSAKYALPLHLALRMRPIYVRDALPTIQTNAQKAPPKYYPQSWTPKSLLGS